MARFSAAKNPLASPIESVMSLSKPTILIRSVVDDLRSDFPESLAERSYTNELLSLNLERRTAAR